MADDFPINDYDQLSTGDLRHRIRSLSGDELRQVLEHEREHANRAQVEQLLITRLDELADGAQPAGGDQRNAPGATDTPRTSPVSPAHSPDDRTPLRHGVAEQTPGRARG
ncbi:hypothetical protein KIPE111705_15600 [Kibdelosporangium persicum]|uniref:hypothetical protein n=1 Tax=Kibdelosporangium persicum TaxID=2698649 RepID=UPI00156385CF|nr:hypothetical protein [Kibdelosporangium persicum]